jgi:hypothetical protein
LPNSAGKAHERCAARLGKLFLDSEFSRAALIFLLSFSMISAGVFLARLCPPRHSSQTQHKIRTKSGRRAAPPLALLCLGKVGPTALRGFRRENRLSRRSKVI